MNAPAKFGPKAGGSYLDRAKAHWHPLPDWVEALARAADAASSQGALAKRLDCSPTAISALIPNNYPGRTHVMEAKVRGLLMSERVECPVLGSLARNDCVSNQSLKFSAANPQRAQLYRACRGGCPNAIASIKESN